MDAITGLGKSVWDRDKQPTEKTPQQDQKKIHIKKTKQNAGRSLSHWLRVPITTLGKRNRDFIQSPSKEPL